MHAYPPEARRELVLRVFPELRFGGDQDLERYFELRKAGRLGEALSLYNGPLRARYPDDSSRILLLRLFRVGDPRWRELHARLLDALGERLASRAEANIDALVEPVAAASLRSAYGALGAVEGLLARLHSAGSTESALELLERYLGFARTLKHRVHELERARDLLRDYLALAAAEAPDEQDFVARSKALEERRRAAASPADRVGTGTRYESVDFIARSEALEERKREAERSHSRYFDLSRLSFSAAERARIEIDPLPPRHEDLVLAYCLKYWKAALDPGFERLVFLYSRKYGSQHHELCRAIRIGRLRKRSDDEILTALSGLLSLRYSYSVMGDLYMQNTWKKLKAGMESGESPPAPAPAPVISSSAPSRPLVGASEPPPPQPVQARPSIRASENKARFEPGPFFDTERQSRPLPAFAAKPPAFALKRPPSSESRAEARPEPAALRVTAPDSLPTRRSPGPSAGLPERRSPAPYPSREPRLLSRSEEPSTPPNPTKARAQPRLEAHRAAPGPAARLLAPAPPPPEPLAMIKPRGGSISDRIRRLSGKNYDVYKSIFLEKVRDDIRKRLLGSRTKRAGIFDTSANEAEDIVYGFMSTHYEDPFMDWEGSGERALVEELGYALPSLDPIVEACYRRL